MAKIFNLGNHNTPTTNCSSVSPITNRLREEIDKFCEGRETDPCAEVGRKKRWGTAYNCDPMQTGQIVNDMLTKPNNHINRYTNAIRGCDQAMTEMVSKFVVLDEDGKAHPVPVIYGTQERAVTVIMQNNVMKDNSLVVHRPTLPLIALHSSDGPTFDANRYIYHKAKQINRGNDGKPLSHQELLQKDTVFGVSAGLPVNIGYTIYAWTYYLEDMNQIVEQMLLKFLPMAYIKIQGVPWEVGVKLDSVANNIDIEPGDQNLRVIKYQFNATAETYIPQPIERLKTVLNIKTDFYNSVDEKKIAEVYDRQEIGTDD